jgi:hypothetical protein
VATEEGCILNLRALDLLVLDKLGRWGNVGAADPLQNFIDDDDRDRDPHDSLPFLNIERDNNKDLGEERYIQNHEVQNHGKGNGKDQVRVSPQLKGQERLVCAQAGRINKSLVYYESTMRRRD